MHTPLKNEPGASSSAKPAFGFPCLVGVFAHPATISGANYEASPLPPNPRHLAYSILGFELQSLGELSRENSVLMNVKSAAIGLDRMVTELMKERTPDPEMELQIRCASLLIAISTVRCALISERERLGDGGVTGVSRTPVEIAEEYQVLAGLESSHIEEILQALSSFENKDGAIQHPQRIDLLMKACSQFKAALLEGSASDPVA